MKLYKVSRKVSFGERFPELEGKIKGDELYLRPGTFLIEEGGRYYEARKGRERKITNHHWIKEAVTELRDKQIIIHLDYGKYGTNQTYIFHDEYLSVAVHKAFDTMSWEIAKVIVDQSLEDIERMPREYIYDRYEDVVQVLNDNFPHHLKEDALRALCGQNGITFFEGDVIIK